MAVSEVITKEIERMQNSVKREAATENRVATLTLAMEKLAENMEASTPLPEESNFTSWREWQEDIEKDIKSANTSLKTIEEYKDLIMALSQYVEENQGI